MSDNRMPASSLRRERAEATLLSWAFALSLGLHLVAWGSFELGKQFGWWQRVHWPDWLKPPGMLTEILKKRPAEQIQRVEEIPRIFVDVNPAQAAPEPPKDAKYYSNKNSRAANEQADQETATPKIEGKRPDLAKTEDVPREKFTPLQPVPPVPKAKEPQEEAKAVTTYKPGDLTMTKPDLNPKKDEGREKQSRPKTVQEAKARLQENQLAGQKMKLEGGVSLHSKNSVDAKATPFGEYDYFLVMAISQCWHALLEEQSYASDYRGKVVVQFQLHYDGRITELNIAENTAGSIPGSICETAVEKPRPYSKFPADMRRVVGDTRHIQFTFYYD
jgi:hypothetical protein